MRKLKKNYVALLLLTGLSSAGSLTAQINYSMTPSNAGYTPLSGGTSIPDLSAGSDLTVSPAVPIGFNFIYDGTTYTDIQISDNGYIHLGSDLGTTGYGNAGGDEVIPNDLSDATGSTPGINTTRPFLAPLWEELAIANIGGNVSYLTSGIAPNQILTVEWDKVSWRAPTGTDQVSFQVVLHETTNVIDFIYRADAAALGPLPTASIGLAGITNGDYYSLSDDGTNPVVSKTVSTTDIGVKPATGQMYTWVPVPVAGISAVNSGIVSPVIYFEQGLNRLNISGDFKATGNFSVDVVDISGRVIYQTIMPVETKGKNNFKVAIPSCAPGIYFARISGSNVLFQSKFIKE